MFSPPQNPRPSCHAVIHDTDGRLLLIRRGSEPFKGYWGLPGGAVELGETVSEALGREVEEETGLRVNPGRLLRFKDAIGRNEKGEITHHYVVLFFTAEVAGGTLTAGSDAREAHWVEPPMVSRYKLVPGTADIIEMAVKSR